VACFAGLVQSVNAQIMKSDANLKPKVEPSYTGFWRPVRMGTKSVEPGAYIQLSKPVRACAKQVWVHGNFQGRSDRPQQTRSTSRNRSDAFTGPGNFAGWSIATGRQAESIKSAPPQKRRVIREGVSGRLSKIVFDEPLDKRDGPYRWRPG